MTMTDYRAVCDCNHPQKSHLDSRGDWSACGSPGCGCLAFWCLIPAPVRLVPMPNGMGEHIAMVEDDLKRRIDDGELPLPPGSEIRWDVQPIGTLKES